MTKYRILSPHYKKHSTFASGEHTFRPVDTMNLFEKTYSILAIAFALALLTALVLNQQLREIQFLIPISFAGLVINIGLLFIVLRDILSRPFPDPNRKYFWLVLILLFWPAIIYYLPRHGFLPRTPACK